MHLNALGIITILALGLIVAPTGACADSEPLPMRPPAVVTDDGVQVGWLGILVSSTSPVLRHQLALENDAGLVVDYVQPQSPAERAGVNRYDVLLKLGDQILVNAAQLQALLALRHAGEVVQLEVFRTGHRDHVSATLGAPPSSTSPSGRQVPVRGQPAVSLLRSNAVGGNVLLGNAVDVSAQNAAAGNDEGWRGFSITVDNGDARHITVADEKGATVYDGPYLTPEQKAQVPEQARAVLDGVLAHADLLPPRSDENAAIHAPCLLTLADGVTINASSTHVSTRAADAEGPPGVLLDGDPSTRWSSAYADHQWVDIDLGKARPLSGLALLWETAAAKRYAVLASDDHQNWTEVSAARDGKAGPRTDLIDLHGHAMRYLRLRLDERASQWGFSLYEIMIFPSAP